MKCLVLYIIAYGNKWQERVLIYMGKNMMIQKLKNCALLVDKPWYGWEVGGLFLVILIACFQPRF